MAKKVSEPEVENHVVETPVEVKPKKTQKKPKKETIPEEFKTNIPKLNKILTNFELMIKSCIKFKNNVLTIGFGYKNKVYPDLKWYIDYKRNNALNGDMCEFSKETETLIRKVIVILDENYPVVSEAIRSDFKK
jgi:hypothetical protein